jgi:hypothetical protein
LLSRSETPEHSYQLVERPIIAEYKFIPSHEGQTTGLDSFPATLPIVEIQFELHESINVAAVNVIAPNGLGDWTTRPVKNTWGIGIVNIKGGVLTVINKGPRTEKMKLTVSRNLILWFPDNGGLSKCPELQVEFLLDSGKFINAIADCKL